MVAASGKPSIRDIEDHALDAWPALDTIRFGGWVFRFSEGYTKRANSANALAPALPFAQVHGEALRRYGARGLPPVFRIGPLAGADPDRTLDALGYRTLRESLVLTAPVPDLHAHPAADPAADGTVRIAPAPDRDWLDAHDPERPEERDLHARILAATGLPAAHATLVEGGQPVAFGRAVAGRGLAGLFSILTLPQARGRGAGRRVVASLLAWARTQGADTAYLQVEADNAPALGLYGRLGFTEAYRYHYRVP